MCFPRVPVIVIVILRYGCGEGLLKYINVGDKSTMVARLPQQVFLLLVLVTGTTMGIGMYGMELPKSTKSSHPTDIRQDENSGNHPSKKILHKSISRFEEASNSQISISKGDSSNIRTKNLEDRKFASWDQEMHRVNVESQMPSKELKTRYARDESASPLLSPLTDRVEVQSISRRDGFARLQGKETWETSSSSAFYHSLEDPPSLRSRRTSGSFLLSSPTSHPLYLSSSSMTSTFSSNDMPPTSPSSHSLSSEVRFPSSDDYPETTLPSSSTSTNSIPVSQVLALDDEFSKSTDQIEDEKMRNVANEESTLERFPNEFTETTQLSSSTSTDNVSVQSILEMDDKFPKSNDQIENKTIGSPEIEDSGFERFSNEFSKTTQLISRTSTDGVPVNRILKLDGNFFKSSDKMKDKTMESREIEASRIETFSDEFSKTIPPSSSTSTYSILISRTLELDDQLSKSGVTTEDKTMGSGEIEASRIERFSNEFSKTTLPSSSTSTNIIPTSRILDLDDQLSKSVVTTEDKTMGSGEIEASRIERFSNEFSKTTPPNPTTRTNSIPVSRILELNDKFFRSTDRSKDRTMESSEIEFPKIERFSSEFLKTTQLSSSTSTNSIPVRRIPEFEKKFSKEAVQNEDHRIQNSITEATMLEWFPTEFSKTTTISLSASISNVPVSGIPELAKKLSNLIVQIEDKRIGSSQIEISKLARFPNKLQSFGTAKQILTTELPTNALSIVHKNNIKSPTWPFTGNENEIRHFDWLTGNRAALTAITLPQTTGFGFSKRYTRDSPMVDRCESFEIGDPVKREFYSPNYPENYPPVTDCVLVLEAEKGELLKLDFRETFELETRTPDGECRFDYLEVRDGQYGFSPKIGTYCGKTFPPEIISQSRYLWLNFHSDDTIEYQGFKAVWSTVPRPDTDAIPVEQEPCIYYEDIQADFELKSDKLKEVKKISETNRVALDCLWVLKANESMKMQLTFDSFKLEKPNDCSANFLDIFDGKTDEPSRYKKFCGSIAEPLSTKTNMMYVRLYLELKAINSSFAALITAVRDKGANQANCKPNEFDCQDATCIASSLKCNKRKNCRFQGDEAPAECGTGNEKQDRSRIIIILVIFSLIMFGMCSAFVFNCVRKLRRDHRIIREHIRQSREDRLDEIGRRATPCPLSVSRTDLRDGGSESPAGEEVDSSKELIPAATLTTREYTKELTLKMKYGTKEITDIHQSNNVSNATQERLQESSEEPDMCDSSCQTRESLFAPIIPDAILSSPAFSTFGYETITGPENGLSHKGTPTSDQSYRHHRHQHHPPPLKQTSSQRSQESQRKNSQVSGYPISERCSHEGSAQICPKHNPIPAPPGWSLHDPPYPQIVPEPSGCPDGGDNTSYRRYQSPKPEHESSIGPSIYQQHQYQYPPPVFTRQNTVGSGERYGSYIYGSGRASSNTASSNATTTSATTTPTTSNTTGSGSPHSATPKHSKTDPRYRAEAVIEVDQKRPFSIESTKSAPDVIATH